MKTQIVLFASIVGITSLLALSPCAPAQTASEWGHAAVDTGKDAVHATSHAIHSVVDDPILIEKAKHVLSNDPETRNQPILVSANNGVVILKGQVPRPVAERAVRLVRGIDGARGVDNDMLYPASPTSLYAPAPQPPYAETAPVEKFAPPAGR